MLVFGLVSCGPPPEETVLDRAKKYFATYKTTYGSTNDSVIISENELKIIETGGSSDYLNFAIDTWEDVDNIPGDIKDPSVSVSESDFKNGFKITGKITTQQGYVGSGTQTAPTLSATDAKADKTGPDCWMYLWLGDSMYGKVLIRSPISKEGGVSTKNYVPVSSSNSDARVYYTDR